MTKSNKVETEAELQARLERRIRDVLPLLPVEIRLERYLHLRLGHSKSVIDGYGDEKGSSRGRYDVLVLFEGKPLLLVELKAPDVEVVEDDVLQALSYARAHDPLVPLVMVSNGTSTILRRVYDETNLEPASVAAESLKETLGAATRLAATASEDAINVLLGSDPRVWRPILKEWSTEALRHITGSVGDFHLPLVEGFVIERELSGSIIDGLKSGEKLQVLHGPPLVGVTNVLAQVAQTFDLSPVLFVGDIGNDDPLQYLANRLSRSLSFGVSKDSIRSWLNTGRGLSGIVIVIDGIPESGINELVDLAQSGLLQLVIGLSSEKFRRVSQVQGRNSLTAFGRVARRTVELKPLSDAEFDSALEALYSKFGAIFITGALHAPELRLPQTLRVIASTLPPKNIEKVDSQGRVAVSVIPPIPDMWLLDACAKVIVRKPELKFDLQKLARAFNAEVTQQAGNSDWIADTWGRPSIAPETAEKFLGSSRLDRLVNLGFVSWVDTSRLGPRLLIRMEELLAHFIAEEWSMVLTVSDVENVSEEIDRLGRIATYLPAGHSALAAAICRSASSNPSKFSVAIEHLIKQEPTSSKYEDGTQFELLTKSGPIRVQLGEGMDKEIVSNIDPWIVLSHIMAQPFEVVSPERDDESHTGNLKVFYEIGKSKHLLFRPKPWDFTETKPIHTHEIPGMGSFPCFSSGIIEPLLQAMYSHFMIYPKELTLLAEAAREEAEPHLAWRVLTVSFLLATAVDEDVARGAKNAQEILSDSWKSAIETAMKEHGKRDSGHS